MPRPLHPSSDPPPSPARRVLAALALVLGIALLWSWLGADGGGERPAAVEAEPDAPVQAAAAATSGGDTPAVQRSFVASDEAPEEPPAAPVDLAHAFSFAFDVALIDEYGLPVPEAVVFVAPSACGFARWPEPSDSRGELRLRWRGRARTMRVEVAVLAWGVLQPMRRFELEAEKPRRVALPIAARRQDEATLARIAERDEYDRRRDRERVRHGRLRKRDDLDVLCGRTQLLFGAFECVDCHEPSRVAAYENLARAPIARPGLHPFAVFADLGAGAAAEEAPAATGDESSERVVRRQQGDRNRPPPRRNAAVATVRGTVVDRDGEPAALVPVAWLDRDGGLRLVTETDAFGRFRLEPVAEGVLRLVAGGGDQGRAEGLVTAFAALAVEWHGRLDPGSVVRGSVHDEQGLPLVGWRVEFERDTGDSADWATTRDDGAFTFTDVLGGGQCLVWANDGSCRLPLLYGRFALADAAPVALTLDPAAPTRARLRVHPVLPPSFAKARVEVRVVQLDTGRVAPLVASGHDDSFELECLPTGPYTVELGAPVLGWVETRAIPLDGRGLWDLGRVHLPTPARVRLVPARGVASPLDREHALYRRNPEVDVRAAYHRERDDELVVAPGDYVLVWRDESGTRAVAFQAIDGELRDVLIGRN